MFSGQKNEPGQPQSAETFIGPSVKLEGTFSSEGDVVVEGILVGTLATKGDVRVGTNAVIEAEIRAKNVHIAGKIKGNIVASNHLRLASTAVVAGDVKAVSLAVEDGAILNGKITMARDKIVKEFSTAEPVSAKAKS